MRAFARRGNKAISSRTCGCRAEHRVEVAVPSTGRPSISRRRSAFKAPRKPLITRGDFGPFCTLGYYPT